MDGVMDSASNGSTHMATSALRSAPLMTGNVAQHAPSSQVHSNSSSPGSSNTFSHAPHSIQESSQYTLGQQNSALYANTHRGGNNVPNNFSHAPAWPVHPVLVDTVNELGHNRDHNTTSGNETANNAPSVLEWMAHHAPYSFNGTLNGSAASFNNSYGHETHTPNGQHRYVPQAPHMFDDSVERAPQLQDNAGGHSDRLQSYSTSPSMPSQDSIVQNVPNQQNNFVRQSHGQQQRHHHSGLPASSQDRNIQYVPQAPSHQNAFGYAYGQQHNYSGPITASQHGNTQQNNVQYDSVLHGNFQPRDTHPNNNHHGNPQHNNPQHQYASHSHEVQQVNFQRSNAQHEQYPHKETGSSPYGQQATNSTFGAPLRNSGPETASYSQNAVVGPARELQRSHSVLTPPLQDHTIGQQHQFLGGISEYARSPQRDISTNPSVGSHMAQLHDIALAHASSQQRSIAQLPQTSIVNHSPYVEHDIAYGSQLQSNSIADGLQQQNNVAGHGLTPYTSTVNYRPDVARSSTSVTPPSNFTQEHEQNANKVSRTNLPQKRRLEDAPPQLRQGYAATGDHSPSPPKKVRHNSAIPESLSKSRQGGAITHSPVNRPQHWDSSVDNYDIDVVRNVRSVAYHVAHPPPNAFKANKVTRSWLKRKFPQDFKSEKRFLKVHSALHHFGRERLNMTETMWNALNEDNVSLRPDYPNKIEDRQIVRCDEAHSLQDHSQAGVASFACVECPETLMDAKEPPVKHMMCPACICQHENALANTPELAKLVRGSAWDKLCENCMQNATFLQQCTCQWDIPRCLNHRRAHLEGLMVELSQKSMTDALEVEMNMCAECLVNPVTTGVEYAWKCQVCNGMFVLPHDTRLMWLPNGPPPKNQSERTKPFVVPSTPAPIGLGITGLHDLSGSTTAAKRPDSTGSAASTAEHAPTHLSTIDGIHVPAAIVASVSGPTSPLQEQNNVRVNPQVTHQGQKIVGDNLTAINNTQNTLIAGQEAVGANQEVASQGELAVAENCVAVGGNLPAFVEIPAADTHVSAHPLQQQEAGVHGQDAIGENLEAVGGHLMAMGGETEAAIVGVQERVLIGQEAVGESVITVTEAEELLRDMPEIDFDFSYAAVGNNQEEAGDDRNVIGGNQDVVRDNQQDAGHDKDELDYLFEGPGASNGEELGVAVDEG